MADGHQRDQGQGREGRASRRRSTASMARSSHTPPASAPTRSWPTGCRRKRPRRCRGTRPLVHSDRGCHCRWPGWLGLMERFGLTRSMSAKGCSPDNAAAEGFFGRMKTEAVYPEKWEEHTRNEVLALVDEYIRWHDHERIKQSLGWMSPVQYRQSQGMAA